MFNEIVNEIETRCKNPLETQSSIALSYANMLRYLDFISDDKIKIANNAIKARYPSKSGLARVKKMAWTIVEKHPTKIQTFANGVTFSINASKMDCRNQLTVTAPGSFTLVKSQPCLIRLSNAWSDMR